MVRTCSKVHTTVHLDDTLATGDITYSCTKLSFQQKIFGMKITGNAITPFCEDFVTASVFHFTDETLIGLDVIQAFKWTLEIREYGYRGIIERMANSGLLA